MTLARAPLWGAWRYHTNEMMPLSVLARKRSLSELEFYANAIRLRRDMTFLLLRDLGLKTVVRNMRVNTKMMDEEDAAIFSGLVDKYQLKIAGEYPEWLIEKLRSSVWDILRELMLNITRAYTIWATCKAEADERRIAQDRAIACCESLLKELELAVEVLPIDAEKYMRYVDMIEREIALLKGWRKADNKKNRTLQ